MESTTSKNANGKIERRLYLSILQSIEHGGLSVERFVESWFEEHGRAYYFVFLKNLSVTNIQYAELAALIRRNLVTSSSELQVPHPLFLSYEEFEEGLEDIVESFSSAPVSPGPLARTLASLYTPLIGRMVVLEPLFGSCAVYVPPNLELNLAAICGESGYLHSCGELVFLVRSDRTSPDALLSAVHAHLETCETTLPLRLVLYGKEDFGAEAKAEDVDLRFGLADVQVYLDKAFVDDMRLVDFARFLEQQMPKRIVYDDRPTPGAERRRPVDVDTNSSLFILMDRTLGRQSQAPGAERFYIMYQQFFKNENPMHVFEENKPAWWSPTTMPHTLVGAMINITAPSWREGVPIHLCDPFAGSGTTLFEALKFENLSCQASDLEEMAPLLARDNMLFLTYKSRTLSRIITELETAIDGEGRDLRAPDFLKMGQDSRHYQAVKKLLEEAVGDNGLFEVKFTPKFVVKLSRRPRKQRLWFYLGLRAVLRHASAFERGAQQWEAAFVEEAKALISQMKRLRELRRREEKSGERLGPLKVYKGRYSRAVSLDVERLREKGGGFSSVGALLSISNATSLPADSFDVVVTDPPYGFNTDEDLVGLATLYREVITSILRSLHDGGQIVLCLPERSYTGRRTRSFARSRFFTEEVEACCEELQLEVQVIHQGGLSGWRFLGPPYYWEAEKALRRSILHFQIRRPMAKDRLRSSR